MRPLSSFVLLVFLALPCSAQSSTDVPRDGLELLKRVVKHYTDATSYVIESTSELNRDIGLQRTWEKTILLAAEATGHRARYESQGPFGSAAQVSDGKTIWTYRKNLHLFVKEASGGPSQNRPYEMDEMLLLTARHLRQEIPDEVKRMNSATRREDDNLVINGVNVPCYVVRARTEDLKRVVPGTSFETTFWIDKKSETVRKTLSHSHINLTIGSTSIPAEQEIVTTYSRAELDRPLPDEFFIFTPPADAKPVERFGNWVEPGKGVLFGQQAPPLKLKNAAGEEIALNTFHGKPVVIDIWATWCAPCIAGLAQLATLYDELKGKGIALLSIDQDEEEKKATDLLIEKGYKWPNFHDDGGIEKQLGSSPVPRTMVIDQTGKVVYDSLQNGENLSALRAAIAKLGPEYASLAPKPATVPCGVVATTKDSR